MFGGAESVLLHSGATLQCGCDSDVWVELRRPDGTSQRVELLGLSGNYGGSELVVSADQRLAALFVFSGQSEQGYELLELVPVLRRVGGLPLVVGQGDVPLFSPDGGWLAMVVVTCCPVVRGTETSAEEGPRPRRRGHRPHRLG